MTQNSMKFLLHSAKNGCRLGTIIPEETTSCLADKCLETPMSMLCTKSGSVPYLVRDVLDKLSSLPGLVHIPINLMADHHETIAEYSQGVAAFSGLEGFLVYCSVQDSASAVPNGFNEKNSIAMWGRGGKLKMNMELFQRIHKAFQPHWIQCLCDSDTNKESSKKRLRKSCDRSIAFLDQFVDHLEKSKLSPDGAVIGVVQGGYSEEERLRSVEETVKRKVAGFAVEGFHNMGPDSEQFDVESVDKLLSIVMGALPEDKVRLFPGVMHPVNVVRAVERGIDIFDSSYPYIVTERGRALTFTFDPCEHVAVVQTSPDTSGSTPDAGGVAGDHSFEISLNDKRYVDDFGPLVTSCSCYTCQNHTRAYVNHLLNTSEMLSGVLLMIHNLHHYFSFFAAMRKAIAADRFLQFKEHIVAQHR